MWRSDRELQSMNRFLSHIAACHTGRIPGDRLVLRIGEEPVGLLRPALAAALAALSADVTIGADGVTLRAEAAGDLHALAQRLAEAGHFRFRNEAFDVRGEISGDVLARIDRGALPAFGIRAEGVHVNGLVRRGADWHVWVARRAANKLLDAGKLDHVVAGGVASGYSVAETLVKEAGEEAAIPPELAAKAVPVGVVAYAMERVEGLRRDRLFCYDLLLPADFQPQPTDGEVEVFELWPIEKAFQTVAETDDFKFNVALVMIDLFLRLGLIDPQTAEGEAIRRALRQGVP
jgi:8-oxo-dGTP pyrophosphatase MutT (NUDIX family)